MKRKQTYHLGLVKGTGNVKCWGNNHRGGTLVLQARRSVDFLSPSLWHYLGQRETTKAHLQEHKTELLAAFNKQYATTFTRLLVD